MGVFIFEWTEEPIAFSIASGNDESARIMISKLFTVPNAANEEERIIAYNNYIEFIRAN